MIKYVFLVIILLSVYALMVFALSRMNLIRPYRFLQMRYVFASAAYSLIMSIAFIFMLGAIDMIMSVDAINRIVLEGVPSTSYSAAFMLLITLFGNILFMLGAVIVSAVCKKISREKTEYSDSAIETWLEGIAERFYNIDSEEGIPFIRPEHILSAKWMNSVRKIILALFIIFVCLSCMKLYSGVGFSSKFLLKILKYVFIIISAAYYPIAEVFYFLDGPEKREDLVEFDIDEIGFIRKGNYERLIPYLEDKYDDMIANINKCFLERAHIEEYMINDVGSQMLRRSNNDAAFESIINSVKFNCVKLSETYKEVTLSLTEGDSVIINDSIYGEVLLYLAGFLNYKLSSGCKALVVTSHKTRVKRIRQELADRLARINDLDSIWNIETAESDWSDSTDILICPIDRFDMIGNKDFMTQIGCVIVDDPSGSFVSSEVAQRMTYMRISDLLKEDTLQFIFVCNEDNRNLEESLEHIVGQDLKPFKNTTAKSDFYCIVWKNESFTQPQTRIGIKPYIGNSSLIALEAAKAGIRSVGMWVDGSVPYITYRDMMMQNIDEIQQRFLQRSTINMNDIITYNESENYRKGLTEKNIFVTKEENDLKFIIEYDIDNNLLAVVKTWSNYALDTNTLITVISDAYMLRGYFADNLQKLIHRPSLVKQIIPSKGEDLHRSNELLILRLYNGMRSDYLVDAFNSFNGTSYSSDEVEICLESLLRSVCPAKYHNTGVYNNFTFTIEEFFTNDNNDPQYEVVYNIKLTNAKIYDYVLRRRKYCTIRFGSTDTTEIIPVEVEDVFNYYLPNQIHCFDGELAVIKEITPTGELLLERTSPQDISAYRQIAEYTGASSCAEHALIDHNGKYSLNEIYADLCWEISGYYNFKKGSTFYLKDEKAGSRATFEKTTIPETIKVVRPNSRGVFIRLQQKLENKEKVEFTISLILNELFKTLLPNNYNDIASFVIRTEAVNTLLNSIPEEEKPIAETIPTIKLTDYTPSEYPEIVIFEKSASEKGLLSECIDEVNFQNILDIVYSYLKWELETDSTENRYLLFGFDNYPSIFDVEEVFTFIEGVRTMNDVDEEVSFMGDTSNICPYCGRALGIEYVETSDGRHMCVDCRNQVVQTQKERDEIYRDAAAKLIDTYNLGKKPWNIKKIAFKNLKEIKKETGSDQVLGFYHFGKRELWVLKGVPRAFEFSTFTHELVHAWQHEALNLKVEDHRDMAEGHAMWVEIEMCRREHQDAYADYLEYCLENDKIIAEIDDGNGNRITFSYSVGYKEMKRRMSEKKDSENAFDIARQWFEEIS